MTIQRASALYPVNSTVMDSAAGVDMRRLRDSEPGANDDTQTATATHTQDNVERTFDPATGGVTNTNNAGTTLFKSGWISYLLDDMAPPSYFSEDASSNANDCLISGAPGLIAGETGFGSRLDLNSGSALLDGSRGGRSKNTINLATLSALTVECRVRRDRTGAVDVIFALLDYIGGTTLNGLQIYFAQSGSPAGPDAIMEVYSAGVRTVRLFSAPADINIGEHTVALEWTGSTIYFFIDGVKQAQAALASLPSVSVPLWIGRLPMNAAGSNTFPMDGAIDEVRLSNVARYGGANYTPASAPFSSDANTLLLWHLDSINTPCVVMVPAQTVTVSLQTAINQSGGTYTGGTYGPTWRASLWRYDATTETATLIAAGSDATQTWDYTPVTGTLGTFKGVTISIVIGSDVNLAAGEVLLLQVGLNTGTIPNPTVGTATWTYTLRVDNSGTKVTWAAGKAPVAACTFSNSLVGDGVPSRGALQAEISRTPVGKGAVSQSKAAELSRSVTGAGVITYSRETVAAKSFSLTGAGVVTRTLALALARSPAGAGEVSASKATAASKTFDLVGVGVPSMSRAVVAAKSFDLVGKGIITEVHPVQAFRTFNLVGVGEIPVTGDNASTITIPIDEVPTGSGSVIYNGYARSRLVNE